LGTGNSESNEPPPEPGFAWWEAHYARLKYERPGRLLKLWTDRDARKEGLRGNQGFPRKE
jgi:hypothetical protein